MVALTLLTLPILSGCTQYEPEDNCKNKSTFVGDSGARHIVSIDLPFTPGPVAVLSTTQDGVAISRSSKLWLGESGTMLYALDDTRVWAADIGTFELKSIGSVGAQAGHLVGADRESTLLVTDHERSSVWILDETRSTRPVEVPVGPGPGALALGPGHRIAYVSNEWNHSLSLIETGVGDYVLTERSVIVASKTAGEILVLDGDGRPKAHYKGLPKQLLDLAVLPNGETLVATYSELVTTGDPGTIGDGRLVLSEGLVFVDLVTGDVQLAPLDRAPEPHLGNVLARPTGVAVVDGGQRLLVALPGWSGVGVVSLDAAGTDFGRVTELIPVKGHPRWIVAASLTPDLAYLLDTDASEVITLCRNGAVTHRFSLK